MPITAEDIIQRLNLQRHPLEGGYFLETYRSEENVCDEKRGWRSISTAIYYLLTPETFSEIHRVDSDEIFHFYLGDPVEMINITPEGKAKRLILGSDIMGEKENHPGRMVVQWCVPAGIWQGMRLLPGGKFALMGTTVAPGFEYSGYQSGNRDELVKLCPTFQELISSLCR